MDTCIEYDKLSPSWKEEVDKLITRMKGKSNIADIIIEKSDLTYYQLKVSVWKYNSVKGWATIGYLRHNGKLNRWQLCYRPTVLKTEKKPDAGRTGSYN